MVLAAPGLLLTPPPSSFPPKRPLTGPIQPKLDPRMKRRPPPPQTVPAPTDEHLTYTITQTPSDVQSRRAPALINTCHDARFAPHVGANVKAGYIPPAARFPPHRSRPAGYPPNRPPPSAWKSGAGEARRRVGRRRGRPPSSDRQSLRALVMQSSAPDRGQHLTVPISSRL